MIDDNDGFDDDVGRRHLPATGSVRIVSLVPSITELLFDLGLGETVVGRTDFCRHPADRLLAVSSVGGTKTVDQARLAALAPTHVIVNVDETPRPVFDDLVAAGHRVIVTHPQAVEDNLRLYRLLGGIFHRQADAEALAQALTTTLTEADDARATYPERQVLYLIWRKPWMTIGRDTYIARMLAKVNWLTEPADTDDRYPKFTLDEALLRRVDRVLFASEPFPFGDKHLAEFRTAFPAHAHKAQPIDGEMVSWYGSRAIAGLRYLLQWVRDAQ